MSRGLAVQAFSFALQEELHDYYRLLAVLEQELARKIIAESTPTPTNTPSPPPPHAHAHYVTPEDTAPDSSKWVTSLDPKGASGLTLLRLRAWMQEPMDRMCMMARLVDSASPLTGGKHSTQVLYLVFFTVFFIVYATLTLQICPDLYPPHHTIHFLLLLILIVTYLIYF